VRVAVRLGGRHGQRDRDRVGHMAVGVRVAVTMIAIVLMRRVVAGVSCVSVRMSILMVVLMLGMIGALVMRVLVASFVVVLVLVFEGVEFIMERVVDDLERHRIEQRQYAGRHPGCRGCGFDGVGRGAVTQERKRFV
jgi:hypothetical protein